MFTEVIDEWCNVYSVAEGTMYMVYVLGSKFNLAVWQILLGLPTTNVGFISYSIQNH